MQSTSEPLLTTRELAKKLGVHPSTPKKWRHQGRGPAFVRLTDDTIRYEMAAVERWLAARRREPGQAVVPVAEQSAQSGWKAWITSFILSGGKAA